MADPTLTTSPEMRQEAQRQLTRMNTLTGLSAGAKALGSLATGVSSYRTAVQRAAVYSANAASIRATIPFVQEAAGQRVDILRQETGQFIADQRAALAANGVVVDQDTGLEAMVQAAGIGAREVVQSLQASRNEILDLRNRAANQEFEAKMAKRQGQADLIKGIGAAGETLLGAASTISANNKKFALGTT